MAEDVDKQELFEKLEFRGEELGKPTRAFIDLVPGFGKNSLSAATALLVVPSVNQESNVGKVRAGKEEWDMEIKGYAGSKKDDIMVYGVWDAHLHSICAKKHIHGTS